MFAFYAVFSTLSIAVTLSLSFALAKEILAFSIAPVVGVTIKSEYYRALQVSFALLNNYKNEYSYFSQPHLPLN